MVQMAKHGSILCSILHLTGCGWYLVGEYYNRSNFTWIDVYEIKQRSSQYRYMSCAHWALTLYGVGGSEIYPTNTGEHFYTVLFGVLSLIYLSLTMSFITSLTLELQRLGSEKRNRDNLI